MINEVFGVVDMERDSLKNTKFGCFITRSKISLKILEDMLLDIALVQVNRLLLLQSLNKLR